MVKCVYDFLFLIFNILLGLCSTENCLILSASNSFGNIGFDSCFTQSLDNCSEIIVYYSNTSVSGLSFGFKNGSNVSYMENLVFNKSEKIDLINLYLIGVDVWIGSDGINGLQFQVYDSFMNRTSLMGSTSGCFYFLNSTFMKSKYFKINSISGCVDNKNSQVMPSLGFKFSFSQCPIFNRSSPPTVITDDNCIEKSI
jgi:hypothetical protein